MSRKRPTAGAAAADPDAARLTELEARINREPAAAEAYLEMAAILSRRREPDMAAQILRAGLAQAPRHLGLLTNLGGLLAAGDKPEEGIDYLRQVVERMPRSYLGHFNLAIGLKTAGDGSLSVDKAIESLLTRPIGAEV